jgi:hypothetical protein
VNQVKEVNRVFKDLLGQEDQEDLLDQVDKVEPQVSLDLLECLDH